jgi:hypothetical protein
MIVWMQTVNPKSHVAGEYGNGNLIQKYCFSQSHLKLVSFAAPLSEGMAFA